MNNALFLHLLGDELHERSCDLKTATQRAATLGVLPAFVRFVKANDDYVLDETARILKHQHAAQSRVLADALKRVSALLPMPFIVLKGLPFAEIYFSSRSARQVADIDILVDDVDRQNAVNLLQSIGFKLDGAGIRPWAYNQVALREPATNIVVEVHWRLTIPPVPCPDNRTLFDNAIPYGFDDQNFLVLSDCHALLHQALHYIQHDGFPKGLIDFAACLDGCSTKAIGQAQSVAEKLGLTTILSWPATSLRLLGHDVPSIKATPMAVRRATENVQKISGILRRGDVSKIPSFGRQLQNAVLYDKLSDRVLTGVYPLFLGPHRLGNFIGPKLLQMKNRA